MIVVIPRTWPLGKDGVAAAANSEWLPRVCPACQIGEVIGHGRRRRQAHDAEHSHILVRRGRCKGCFVTITVLPAWALPWTHYSLAARACAVQRCVEQQMTLERSAPDTQAARIADPATIRRWFQRRLASHWLCLSKLAWLAHTILAWDFPAAARMLIPEAQPA